MLAYKSIKKISLILVFFFGLFLFGCSTQEPIDETIKKIENIQIVGQNELEIGDIIYLEAEYDQTITVDLVWSSSDQSVLLVFGNEVTAKKEGTATVTVTDQISKVKAEFKVTVKAKEIEQQDDIDSLLNWAVNQLGTEGYDEVVLPVKHPSYDCIYEWSSADSDLFDPESGLLGLYETDKVVSITCKAVYGSQTKEKTYDFTVLGYATYDIADEFMEQFRANKIFYDMNLKTTYDDFGGAYVTWSSSDEAIFSSEGVFNKPLYETEVILTFVVNIPSLNVEREFKEVLLAQPLTIQEKCDLVEAWILSNVSKNGYLYKDTYLPKYVEDYMCSLSWFNESGTELKLDFSASNPILGEGINATINISDGINSENIVLSFKTMTEEITDPWEKIKLFTDTIASSALTSYKYLLVSWSSLELGYIPFYDNNNSNILVDILPYTYGKVRTNILKSSTEYIVIHDTGSPGKGGNAAAHNNYIKNINNDPNTSSKSWHFTIGNDGIIQHLPLDEVGWHAGDGSTVFGDVWSSGGYDDRIGGGNRNGIGIESCIDEGCDYTFTMRKMAKLVAELLIQYNLGFDRIKQHWNFSGKNCPQVMRGANRWNEFIYLVKLEYYAKTELQGVTFEWTSLSPDVMDNTGKVTTQLSVGTKVSYKVKITYLGETKEFTYQSVMAQRI